MWKTFQSVNLKSNERSAVGRPLIVPGDLQAHEWIVTVMDGDVDAVLSGWSCAQAFFTRSDGVSVLAEATVSGNVIRVTIPRDACLVAGRLQGLMRLGDSVTVETDPVISLARCEWTVSPVNAEVILDPETVFPTIAGLAEDVTELTSTVSGIGEAVEGLDSQVDGLEELLEGVTQDSGGIHVTPDVEIQGELEAAGGIAGVTNYQANEIATGGTWTDGKAIYRRVIAGDFTKNSVSTAQTQTLASGFTGYDTIVSLRGIIKAPNGLIAALPFGSAYGVSECIGLYVIGSDININFGDHWGTGKYTYRVIVEYTKSSS